MKEGFEDSWNLFFMDVQNVREIGSLLTPQLATQLLAAVERNGMEHQQGFEDSVQSHRRPVGQVHVGRLPQRLLVCPLSRLRSGRSGAGLNGPVV